MPLTIHPNFGVIHTVEPTPIGHGLSLGDRTLSGHSWEGRQILTALRVQLEDEWAQKRHARISVGLTVIILLLLTTTVLAVHAKGF